MDSYKRDNPESSQAKPSDKAGPGGTGPLKKGTGQLSDTFRSTGGTGNLGKPMGSTRRLGSSPLDADRTLEALKVEIENGQLIVGKLDGRLAVLIRAMRIVEKPIDVNQICAGISAGEANFTKQVAKMLQADPHTTRRVQVALYQWEQAKKGLQQAVESHERALQYEGAARAQFVDSHCQVEKLRGQLYPLINLHVVFRDNTLLAQLIPTPKLSNDPPLPPPPPPPPPPPAASTGNTGGLPAAGAKPGTANLAQEIFGADPAVQQMVSSIKQATGNLTGNLKNKLIGMLGGVPKDEKSEPRA